LVCRWGNGLKSANKGWGLGAVVIAFIGLAILRFDLIVSVRYMPAKVVAVRYLPQFGINSRAVLVKLGERERIIRTSSVYVRTDIGTKVCVGETAYLLRTFKRYSLAMRSFCPGMAVLVPQGDGPPVMLPGD
jgi:hypothetical protein